MDGDDDAVEMKTDQLSRPAAAAFLAPPPPPLPALRRLVNYSDSSGSGSPQPEPALVRKLLLMTRRLMATQGAAETEPAPASSAAAVGQVGCAEETAAEDRIRQDVMLTLGGEDERLNEETVGCVQDDVRMVVNQSCVKHDSADRTSIEQKPVPAGRAKVKRPEAGQCDVGVSGKHHSSVMEPMIEEGHVAVSKESLHRPMIDARSEIGMGVPNAVPGRQKALEADGRRRAVRVGQQGSAQAPQGVNGNTGPMSCSASGKKEQAAPQRERPPAPVELLNQASAATDGTSAHFGSDAAGLCHRQSAGTHPAPAAGLTPTSLPSEAVETRARHKRQICSTMVEECELIVIDELPATGSSVSPASPSFSIAERLMSLSRDRSPLSYAGSSAISSSREMRKMVDQEETLDEMARQKLLKLKRAKKKRRSGSSKTKTKSCNRDTGVYPGPPPHKRYPGCIMAPRLTSGLCRLRLHSYGPVFMGVNFPFCMAYWLLWEF